MSAKRNLLLGMLALQNNFISRAQLLAAFNAWIEDKRKSLGALLLEQKALSAEHHALLEALTDAHIRRHDNDTERSLAALSSADSARHDLEHIADADLRESLAALAELPRSDELPDACADRDPYATMSFSAPAGSSCRFRILRPYAEGGLGQVSVARDEELSRVVAIKEIKDRYAHDAGCRARFLREAAITGQLEHPGIVPVYALGTYSDGRPFYAMRFIKGDSLKEAIARFHRGSRGSGIGNRGEGGKSSTATGTTPAPDSPIPTPSFNSREFRSLLGRFLDVCNAIAYAHSRGVLHRDLKPGNIMLGKYGETLVVDWGLAKSGVSPTDDGATDSGLPDSELPATPESLLPAASASGGSETVPGSALGTPAYMSPEQAAGTLDQLGMASDVYSLGSTLYHLLTGKAPFHGGAAEVLKQVQAGDFPRPRQVQPAAPPALEAVCVKAMALGPADRYASARALADEIERWLADEPVAALPESWVARAGRWGRRHRALVTSAAVLLVTAVVALSAGVVLLRREQARTEQARQEARDNFQRAREVVDRMLVRFADSPDGLRDAPGMAELRRKVVEEALAYYEQFLDTDSTDPDVRQEAGRAYVLLGRVRQQAGKAEEAERAFLRGKELFTGLTEEFPTGSAYHLGLAQCQTRLGALYQDQKRFAEACAEYRAAATRCEQLTAKAPDDPRSLFQLAAARNRLGIALREMGEAAAAEAEYRAALPVAQALAGRPDATPDERGAVAHPRNNLANLYTARTEWAKALAELDAVVLIWRGLADEFPKAAEYRSLLAAVEANRIDPLLGLGRKDDAVKAAETSLDLRQRLADDFPTVPGYQLDLAKAHYNQGVTLRDMGQVALAEQSFASAIAAMRKPARALPDLPEYRLMLGRALSTRAALRGQLRRAKDAEDDYRAALVEFRGVVTAHASVRSYRDRLAHTYNNLGKLLINQNRAAAADEPLREAALLWRALRQEAPDEPAYSSSLGMLLGNQAAVCWAGDDLAGARRLLDEAVACHTRALTVSPKHAEYRQQAAREWTRLGDLALQQGDHATGVAAAEHLLTLPGTRADQFYTLACACGRAIAAAEKDAALSPPRRAEAIRAYTARAVASLREVQRDRPFIIIGASAEEDLAPLRARVDLKAALADSPSTAK
jgi:serine/threonine-protein kinase